MTVLAAIAAPTAVAAGIFAALSASLNEGDGRQVCIAVTVGLLAMLGVCALVALGMVTYAVAGGA